MHVHQNFNAIFCFRFHGYYYGCGFNIVSISFKRVRWHAKVVVATTTTATMIIFAVRLCVVTSNLNAITVCACVYVCLWGFFFPLPARGTLFTILLAYYFINFEARIWLPKSSKHSHTWLKHFVPKKGWNLNVGVVVPMKCSTENKCGTNSHIHKDARINIKTHMHTHHATRTTDERRTIPTIEWRGQPNI